MYYIVNHAKYKPALQDNLPELIEKIEHNSAIQKAFNNMHRYQIVDLLLERGKL